MPGFDVQGARKAGYSDDEILAHLNSSRKFDITGALKSGYSKQEIINHLASSAVPTGNPTDNLGGADMIRALAAHAMGGQIVPAAVQQPVQVAGNGAAARAAISVGAKGAELLQVIPSMGATTRQLTELGGVPLNPDGTPMSTAQQWRAVMAGQIPQYSQPTGNVDLNSDFKGMVNMIKEPAQQIGQGNYAQGIPEGVLNLIQLRGGYRIGPDPLAAKVGTQALRESAAGNYSRVLAPTTKANKFTTQQVAPEMVNRAPIAMTRKGLLDKAENNASAANEALNQAWSKIPEADRMPVQDVIDHLENYKKEFVAPNTARQVQETVQSTSPLVDASGRPVVSQRTVTRNIPDAVVDSAAIRHINDVQQILRDMGTEVSPQSLRRVRQIWDQKIANAKGFAGKTLDEGTMLDVTKEASNAIRNELAKQYPDLRAANAEYTFWRRVGDVCSPTR